MFKTETDKAWDLYIKKEKLDKLVKKEGHAIIQASNWKTITNREPRLSFNAPTLDGLPAPLKERKWAIIPRDRGSYIVGPYINLYAKMPQFNAVEKELKDPNLLLVNSSNIKNEDQAITFAEMAGGMHHILELPLSEKIYSVNPGRYGCCEFSQKVKNNIGGIETFTLGKNQIEVDGAFETKDHVVFIEAKAVFSETMLIRQIYAPYRDFIERNPGNKKKIILLFLYFDKNTKKFYFYEVEFTDPQEITSIVFKRQWLFSIKQD